MVRIINLLKTDREEEKKGYNKKRMKLIILSVLLLTGVNQWYSQNKNTSILNNNEYQEYLFVQKAISYIFDRDSLSGFEEDIAFKEIENESTDPLVQKWLMYLKKREFINHKYHLYHEDIDSYFKTGSQNNVYSVACNNEDFETGDFTGWIVNTGVVTDACSGSGCCPNGFGLATVLTTPFTDPYVGAIGASPFGGTRVAQLNDAAVGARAVRIRKNITVGPNNALFQFAYIAVLNVPSNSHPCCAVPKIKIRIIDPSGNILGCPQVEISVPQGGCPPLPAGWVNAGSVVYNPTWQIGSIDLTAFLGQNISIIVDVYDCTWTGHFGYAYFDAICKPITLDVNGIQFPAGSNNISVTACGASTATLTAPAGLAPYNWNGPGGSGIVNNPNQTITTSVAGVYTLVMNPPGICAPIVKTVTLNFSPPISLSVSSSTSSICSGQSVTLSATSSMAGGTYTWSPGGNNAPSVVVSPSSTQIYTVNYTAPNNCPASAQFTVNVNPTPNIALSSATLCSGNSVIINSTVNPGGGTYTWVPTGSNSSSITVTPPTGINTYTLNYITSAGCYSNAVTNVTVYPTPTLAINNPTVCYQSSSVLQPTIIPSSGSYTWLPGGQNTSTIAVSPPSNTTYTLIYQTSDGCTNSIVSNVIVIPNPSITIVGNYTYCESPVNSLVLSPTVSPGGGVYVWYPNYVMSPTIAVSPTATTVYTVQYTDVSTGCKSEATTTVYVRPGFKYLDFKGQPWQLCANNPTTILSSSVIVSSGTYSLYWNLGSIASPSTASGSSVMVSFNTTGGLVPVTLIATNIYSGCKDSIKHNIQIEPLPDINFLYNVVNCRWDSIQFINLSWVGGMSNITNYFWDFGDGNTSNVKDPKHLYLSSGTYTVTLIAQTDFGCTDTLIKPIQVFSEVTAGIILSSQTVCASANQGTLQLSGTMGQVIRWEYSDDYAVTWNPITNTAYQQTYSNLNKTRIYRALVKNGDCPYMYTTPFATVTVDFPSQAGRILGNDTIICVGNNSAQLQLYGYMGNQIQWLYSYDNLNWDTIPNTTNQTQIQLYNIPDTLYVKVTVKNGVCSYDTSKTFVVYVKDFKTYPLYGSSNYNISLGDTITIGVTDGYQFNWSPNYNMLLTNANPTSVFPQKDTIYTVIVKDKYGCSDTVNFRIIVQKDYKLIIANTITPNGDGKNDIWWIGNVENYNDNEVYIFNRYGQMIFEAKNYDNFRVFWDGTYQGNKVPDGTYYYVLKFKDNTIFKGHINVLSSH